MSSANASRNTQNVTIVITKVLLQMKKELVEPIKYQNLCVIDCYGCPKKLLEFLEDFIISWEEQIATGYRPNFGDLSKIIRVAEKSQAALLKNSLIKSL